MKLARIKIQNYRSIKDLELPFPRSGFLILVGANNAGKSNVIRAIDILCGDKWYGKDKTEDHDYYLRDRRNEICVELVFDDGSRAKWDSGAKWASSFLDAGGRKHPEQLKEAFPCVYLGADRTFDKHMSFYDWTLIGRIRKAFHQKAHPIEAQLREKFEEVVTVLDQVPGFANFKRDFTTLFAQMQADTQTKLSIDFKPYTPSNYFKTMQIVAEDSAIGQNLDLDELGEGTRNMVLLALLRSYARNFKGAHNELTGILAVEEPEIYMHPQARRHLFKVLREIASAGMQVVISTHSASFVDTEFFDSIGRVVKIDDDEEPDRQCTQVNLVSRGKLVEHCKKTGVPENKVTKENISEFYKATSNPMLNEAFFARFVILVEGDTEELALPVFLEKEGIDCDLLGISIISVRGKGQIPKYWRLFSAFKIPVLAVADNDDDGSAQKRESNQVLATCFDVALTDLLDVDIAKHVQRRTEPIGALIMVQKDYEASLTQDFSAFQESGAELIAGWETEARELIRPVGDQSKGQIARFVARKMCKTEPGFTPKLIRLIVTELQGSGIVKPAADSPTDAVEDDPDDIPF